jgi:hypothetical protein
MFWTSADVEITLTSDDDCVGIETNPCSGCAVVEWLPTILELSHGGSNRNGDAQRLGGLRVCHSRCTLSHPKCNITLELTNRCVGLSPCGSVFRIGKMSYEVKTTIGERAADEARTCRLTGYSISDTDSWSTQGFVSLKCGNSQPTLRPNASCDTPQLPDCGALFCASGATDYGRRHLRTRSLIRCGRDRSR